MNNLQSVTVHAHGRRGTSFNEYRKENRAEAEIIKYEIDLIEKYLIDDQDVSTELRFISIFGNSVTLEYRYPTWSHKINAERLKSNLEMNSSKIRSFKFTKVWMTVSMRLRNDIRSLEEDYHQLLDYSTPCREASDVVLGFAKSSNLQKIEFADLTKYSPMMIVGESGIGKTEMVISMLDSMMQRSAPRNLQFVLIDRDVDRIVERLGLDDSGYLEKFKPLGLDDRRSIYETLAAVVDEINLRKMLLDRCENFVTYKGFVDQFAQIVVVLDRFDKFVYSRFEIIEMIRLIAKADPRLNVRLIVVSRNTTHSDMLLRMSPKEYFDRNFDLVVNSLVSFNHSLASNKHLRSAEVFNKIGACVKSIETVKLSKDTKF